MNKIFICTSDYSQYVFLLENILKKAMSIARIQISGPTVSQGWANVPYLLGIQYSKLCKGPDFAVLSYVYS